MNILKVNFKQLDKRRYCPIFTYCRKLIKDGVDPKTILEIYRDRPEWDVRVSIGWGAEKNVDESTVSFSKYKAWKGLDHS